MIENKYAKFDEVMFQMIREELVRARKKFPTNKHQLVALGEEAGELNNAFLGNEYSNSPASNVVSEAVQVACMAIRAAVEGDAEFNYKCPLSV